MSLWIPGGRITDLFALASFVPLKFTPGQHFQDNAAAPGHGPWHPWIKLAAETLFSCTLGAGKALCFHSQDSWVWLFHQGILLFGPVLSRRHHLNGNIFQHEPYLQCKVQWCSFLYFLYLLGIFSYSYSFPSPDTSQMLTISIHPYLHVLSLQKLSNQNKQKIPQRQKTENQNKLKPHKTTESVLSWRNIPEHGAYPVVWLRYPVSLYWRKLTLPLIAGISCKYSFH